MGLNDTPSGERTRISFFGRRNAGKSSLVNAFTAQRLSVVSDTPGTTTDPVSKAMELLPLGPVMITDTPGFDDTGDLGQKRIERTRQILAKTDLAVLVIPAGTAAGPCENQLKALFKEHGISHITAYTKLDLYPNPPIPGENEIYVSSRTGENITALRDLVAHMRPEKSSHPLVEGLIAPGGIAILVTPIDAAAPKGRMILPQQQVIRGIIDAGAAALVAREAEFAQMLSSLAVKPAIVITDSQVFEQIAAETPQDIPLTSFSILMARHKGVLSQAVKGAHAIDALAEGDTVLIAEGCTHHRQCEDIGSVKLPRWLGQRTGKRLNIQLCSGTDFPDDLSEIALVIHCGGCMLSPREVESRFARCAMAGVPITNYGTAIAHMKGILERSVSMLPELKFLS